ncbi:disulfide bond formation protein B [Derxia gummosa]|uniref:Disulfide bond formation protein B n=1 Tax=Derxia gummosa DSM 723 TaxID=1121388 RepID=A0A8B6X598_9BURK|nr:disulfide bond formation protein B [Derxia gummosa]
MLKLLNARRALALVCLISVGSMASAYYVQHELGIEPCPLCIVQRLGYVIAGGLALVGALAGTRAWLMRLIAGLATLVSLGGLGVASWHAWLIEHPPESASCGRPFSWMLQNFTLEQLMPRIFAGHGDCLTVEWTLFGFNIPQLSMMLFAAMVLLGLFAVARPIARDSGFGAY